MARSVKDVEETVETAAKDAVKYIEVETHNGAETTLHIANQVIRFIDGKAKVTVELAQELRKRAFIK